MLADAHCHVSTDFDPLKIDELTQCYSKIKDARFVVMSTNHIDYEHVHKLALKTENIIVPSFGVHPWYSHLFTLEPSGCLVDKETHYNSIFNKPITQELLSLLPIPIHLDEHLDKLISLIKQYRDTHDRSVCWGEIGLDKVFRIPNTGFFANPATRHLTESDISLTNYRISMTHQRQVFIKQLRIAIELNLPISIHNVKSSGAIHDIIKEELTPDTTSRICLHSYTGSIDTLKMFLSTFEKNKGASKFYASFSSVINGCGPKREELAQLLDCLPKDRVLSETDVTLDRFIEQGGPLGLLREIVGLLGDEDTLFRNFQDFLGESYT
ncbi:CYFA0S32e00254g1_1 [Cyberlindnera fabianii]|uniref:CYFA0S32e00254g1_1 n=1 Tax=Cyberlindnera fabianii TaxID=36022 RepID=A0A061BBW2_CYBFA|nr:CYFA0S32e00254g1_1 [Cyberlindnera fabianii]